jgi:DNA polymerase
MIVGEAPGAREEEAGRPFVGPAGALLDTALQALGVRRDECYVTNVVKEVPRRSDGKIRAPYDMEIEAWAGLLAVEIVELAPEAILLLGKRTAVRHLAPELEPGQNDGYYFAAWHPSYLLHGANGLENAREIWLDGHLRPWAERLGKFEYA